MNATARPAPIEPTPSTETTALASVLRASPPANDPAPTPQQQALLRRAARAIEAKRVCVIRYASEPGGAPSTRSIEPLAVTSTRGRLGLLAWCRLRRDLRTFRVDRITAITVLGDRYEDHPGLALERFIQRRRRALP
ncbi:MAG: Helix-turn-helix type 11 domain protein [Myxococcaceae bacterium]|nr:Helix-turn-helix type 11 domain protein [Myxococcaceae bacterium]